MKNQIHKNGQVLKDLETWFELAGPKSAHQWKDGRSAKECARAWLEAGGIPHSIRECIESHPDFSEIRAWSAEPEAQVRFDRLRGEPSNLDVLLLIEDDAGPAVVAVEAKADESFGGTIAETLAAADRRLADNPRSKGRVRVEQLVTSILDREVDDPEVGGLRYQLFTATAAGIAEAERREVDRAVVLVHEFVTDATTDERHARNSEDLDRYLNAIGASGARPPRGVLWAPGVVGAEPLFLGQVGVYFGKVSQELRGTR